ncbi:restriction endonuclease subunit S [Silanimonas sp.]|uniref:restriction endonuclease subunit S n=1 Tax=Silanimonas sp. TaxID=1929290 RepID=UPI0022BD9F53|nr:restriction endonuclease subunit S [Silanimonas sp.]MCZ8167199.1 restriction endonuclease subunit S [Silanimonas sp.]
MEIAAQTANATAAGPFGSNLVSRDYVESGVPVIRGQNLQSRWVGGEFVFVTPEKAEALRTNTAKPGDVVFTQRGTLGQVALVPGGVFDRYVISQSQMKLTVDPAKADSAFVYYACISADFTRQVFDNAVAAGVPHINLGILRSLRIPIPSLDVQRGIAAVLGTIDDRIDLFRQTNDTLEAIAHALFKSWFVDFDPVRAKAEGREPEGMDAETAALFPSEFDESELGLIPKGWRAGLLSDFSVLNASKWTSKNHPQSIRYIDLSGVSQNRIDQSTLYIFGEAPSRARHHLRDGDTIIGTVRPGNRAFAYIHEPEATLTGSTGFAVLSPKYKHLSSFVYLAATREEAIARLENLADGGAYPAVRPSVVAETPCIIPCPNTLRRFSELANPLMARVCEGGAHARALADLRDTLLPRLISGKLRMPDVSEFVEEEKA